MATESKRHTPSNWIELRRGFGEFVLDLLGPGEFVTASGLHDGGWIVWKAAEADARLIAAAPDLLEALKELMIILKDVELPIAVEGYVRAAIRKATEPEETR
jgi:hypothetical protein